MVLATGGPPLGKTFKSFTTVVDSKSRSLPTPREVRGGQIPRCPSQWRSCEAAGTGGRCLLLSWAPY